MRYYAILLTLAILALAACSEPELSTRATTTQDSVKPSINFEVDTAWADTINI